MLQGKNELAKALRVGTRASLLARSQTAWVVAQLEKRAGAPALPGGRGNARVETILVTSSGDRIQDRPLYEFGGKGLFTKELEVALLEGRIDVAVHSFKDVPVTLPLVEQAGLCFAAVPRREDARDVLVSKIARRVEELPQKARVGTGSLRRRCQLLAARGDLRIEMIRGNVDTRLKKLREGEFDAVVLAMAGVKRAGLWEESIMSAIETEVMLPSAGQGALVLQCRKDDLATREWVQVLEDQETRACVEMERELVAALGGDCHSPIGAWAQLVEGERILQGMAGAADGELPVRRARGRSVAEVMKALGN
jgi:hydroxymethylbilane synthase